VLDAGRCGKRGQYGKHGELRSYKMQARKLLLSLMAIFIFQSAWAGGGSSGDSCTSHDTGANGGGESEIWRDGTKSYGCNCDRNADLYVGTDYEVYDTSYPYVGKCLSDNGGQWSKTARPCYPEQPGADAILPSGVVARAGRQGMGTCWELWCTGRGQYFIGTMEANGTRLSGNIRFDKCESCPVAEELVITYAADKITLKVQNKQ
jgi:hypothetical protein